MIIFAKLPVEVNMHTIKYVNLNAQLLKDILNLQKTFA